MRERLIELIKKADDEYMDICDRCDKDGYKSYPQYEEFIADRILANGAILPPCDVGCPVYRICKRRYPVDSYRMHWEEDWVILTRPFDLSMTSEIGKTVFLTRKEAEQALKGDQT